MPPWVLILSFVASMLLFKLALGHSRHNTIDGQRVRAWHIELPGHTSTSYPEHTVDLEPFAGSHYGTLRAVYTESGEEHPEVTAGLALLAIGAYSSEHVITPGEDGHFVLHSPARTETHFTWSAYWRVSPWRPVETS